MKFPDTYYTVEGHLFKVSCDRVYQGDVEGTHGLIAEMKIEEVAYTT